MIVQLFSNSLFLRRYKPKMIFGQTTLLDSDRKCKFHRFCPARSDSYNIAHEILSFCKLQGAFIQFTDKIWKLQLKYFSYKRDQRRAFSSTLICISKFTNLYERINNNNNYNIIRQYKLYLLGIVRRTLVERRTLLNVSMKSLCCTPLLS